MPVQLTLPKLLIQEAADVALYAKQLGSYVESHLKLGSLPASLKHQCVCRHSLDCPNCGRLNVQLSSHSCMHTSYG